VCRHSGLSLTLIQVAKGSLSEKAKTTGQQFPGMNDHAIERYFKIA